MTLTIFCVPYAGASSRVYERWRREAGPDEVVRPLELPGRGVPADTAARSVREAAEAVGAGVAVGPDEPYVLFGHSLGALVAFEIAARRDSLRLPRPALLVLSGRNAPTAPPEWARRTHALSDEELFTTVRGNGGLPPGLSLSIAAHYFLPRLRADLRMAAGYRADPARDATDVPLLVLYGRDDPLVQPRRAGEWARFTTAHCTTKPHEGGHFAIIEQFREVVRLIRSELVGDVAGTRGF